jgi:hypothetical protein
VKRKLYFRTEIINPHQANTATAQSCFKPEYRGQREAIGVAKEVPEQAGSAQVISHESWLSLEDGNVPTTHISSVFSVQTGEKFLSQGNHKPTFAFLTRSKKK